MTGTESRELNFARSVVASASPAERDVLLEWAIELREIRRSQLSMIQKARLAVKATAKRTVLVPIVKANAARTRELLWTERGYAARFAIIGMTIGTLGFSGEAAGIAAFGRAIGVPIYVVVAAGGALLGAIIDELQQEGGKSSPSTTYSVIEAHKDTDA